jgi:hypothetical protein
MIKYQIAARADDKRLLTQDAGLPIEFNFGGFVWYLLGCESRRQNQLLPWNH